MDNIKKKNEIQMKLLETVIFDMKNTLDDTSLVVPWLSLCTSTAGDVGLIPGWGIRIPPCSVVWPKIKFKGLPWWLSGEESACQCSRHGFDP